MSVTTTDASTIASRLARLRAELDRAAGGTVAITRALDDVGESLDDLRAACADEGLALRLGSSRAVAASYVRATAHLRDAGARSELCDVVLREGRARLSDDLAEVQRELGRRSHAWGGR